MDIQKIIKVIQFVLKVIAIFLGSFCGSSCANNGDVLSPEIADTLNIDFSTIND